MQVDWTRIRELREEVGEDDYVEILELFFDEVEETVARLAHPGSMAEREADLHFLKGSALNLGFSGLGALCQQAEVGAASGTLSDDDLQAVLGAYREVRAAFGDGAPPAS